MSGISNLVMHASNNSKLPLNSETTVHKNYKKLWDYPGSFGMDNGRNTFCKGNH